MHVPRLDDRSFADLVREADEIVARTCPTWTDRSPGDPGTVLLELFAHLTEVLIYRLNRLPEKAFLEFLKLTGTRQHPPAAARAMLRFHRNAGKEGKDAKEDREVAIPAFARVGVGDAAGGGGGEPIVFTTTAPAVLRAGETQVEVLALHAERVEREAETLRGDGPAGRWIVVARPPIVALTGESDDLVVEVEAAEGEAVPAARKREHGGRTFRRWSEVQSFAEAGGERYAFVADRATGTITFSAPPAPGAVSAGGGALAETPAKDRAIRVSYWRGGGTEGNVVAGALTAPRTPLPAGVAVVNDKPATGGVALESVAAAMSRGPHELYALRRAVTARDYELLARDQGGVARSKALARASLWAHAPHGEVEVLLVPAVAEGERPNGRASIADLKARETEALRGRIATVLAERTPLGTSCTVSWCRYKEVSVEARLLVQRDADPADVAARALRKLNEAISPLPSPGNPTGWGFGRPLRDSQVIGLLLAVPGVVDVHPVALVLAEAPDEAVASLAADPHQAHAFHAAAGDSLHRTLNDGLGWERSMRFPDQKLRAVRVHPTRPGLLAVVSRPAAAEDAATLHVSGDCGETWPEAWRKDVAARVDDLAWSDAPDGLPMLWAATDRGLLKVEVRAGEMRTVQAAVDKGHQDLGFRAVAAFLAHGKLHVAVAAHEGEGVYLSDAGGADGTFRFLGARKKLIRLLAVQTLGPRVFLWAGTDALQQDEPGEGCLRCEVLQGTSPGGDAWEAFSKGWDSGTCYAIDFAGPKVFAASFRGGVLRLDPATPDAGWTASELKCGLPIHGERRSLDRIQALAVAKGFSFVLAGGPNGIFRGERAAEGGDLEFVAVSRRVFHRDPVTLPETWLFASGEHRLTAERSAP